MTERPHSRYTRAKTWAALYSQHINACYALIPFSSTSNSVDVLKCDSPAEAQAVTRRLIRQGKQCEDFYTQRRTRDEAPDFLKKAQQAVVLARSSDYHRYHLAEYPDFRLVICSLHDSYLHLPVWETRTNHHYKPRETAIPLTSPEFLARRKTEFGHNIFLGALLSGDEAALALLHNESIIPARTRRRIMGEVHTLQHKRYQGRPLPFLDERERREIGSKISAGLRRYHATRRA